MSGRARSPWESHLRRRPVHAVQLPAPRLRSGAARTRGGAVVAELTGGERHYLHLLRLSPGPRRQGGDLAHARRQVRRAARCSGGWGAAGSSCRGCMKPSMIASSPGRRCAGYLCSPFFRRLGLPTAGVGVIPALLLAWRRRPRRRRRRKSAASVAATAMRTSRRCFISSPQFRLAFSTSRLPALPPLILRLPLLRERRRPLPRVLGREDSCRSARDSSFSPSSSVISRP